MRKYFDNAYEGFCNSFQPIIHLAEIMAEVAKVTFVYVTLPIWVLPYKLIFRKRENDGRSEN